MCPGCRLDWDHMSRTNEPLYLDGLPVGGLSTLEAGCEKGLCRALGSVDSGPDSQIVGSSGIFLSLSVALESDPCSIHLASGKSGYLRWFSPKPHVAASVLSMNAPQSILGAVYVPGVRPPSILTRTHRGTQRDLGKAETGQSHLLHGHQDRGMGT